MRGIGVDIVAIGEFERLVGDSTTSFIKKTFTPAEQEYAAQHLSGDQARHLAARYAAKEALIKALAQAGGAVFRENEVDFLEIEVKNDKNGTPFLMFHGEISKICKKIGISKTFLTLSHDSGMAIAMVVLD